MRIPLAALLCTLPFMFAAGPGERPSFTREPVPADIPLSRPATRPAGIPLFNGQDLTGWTWHSATANSKITDVWTVKDGILRCAAAPTGFIVTEKEYRNFTLSLQYKHITKANGGTFVCIGEGEPGAKPWPNAIQVQGKFGAVGDLINQNKGMKAMTVDPARTTDTGKDLVTKRSKDNVEKPAGEWNDLVIFMQDGNLAVTLNGSLVNTASAITPDHGRIGFQAEGAEMEFRKIEVVPLP